MSILKQSRRGDMYIEINVEIPVNLSKKQKELLKQFENEGGINRSHSPKSQSFLNKIKEAWSEFK